LIGAATAAHQVEGNNVHAAYRVMEHVAHSDFTGPQSMAVSGEAEHKQAL